MENRDKKAPLNDLGPIYLMPFSATAAVIYHFLKDSGIKAAGFLDNNSAITAQNYDGCRIMTPDEAARPRENSAVILCAKKYYTENERQVRGLGFSQIIRPEQALSIQQARAAFKSLDSKALLEIAPKQKGPLERFHREVKSILLPEQAMRPDALIIDRVEVVVTEKCTLKCTGCANMMQYYTKPRTLEPEQICRDFTKLAEQTDYIKSLNIIGGEPFILKRLHEIIYCVMKFEEKIELFEIVTNGTIVPGEEVLRAIKEADCLIRISDYGALSRKKEELTAALDRYGIRYGISSVVWRDVQKIVDPEGNDGQKLYEECHAHCKTVKDGRLYKCPFLAHGETLGAFPPDPRNHVELDESCTKEIIRKCVEGAKAPPGCYYCNGNYSKDAPEIPTAEQITEPVPYRRY